jgi:hypothetical protein
MTTPNQILVDLLSGQSTADSIAGRLRVPTLVIESMLKRHAKDGLTVSGVINQPLLVHRLTTVGIEAAHSLSAQTPARKRSTSEPPASPEPIINA